jgi:hypothetical protein
MFGSGRAADTSSRELANALTAGQNLLHDAGGDYEALQAVDILTSVGRSSICLKQSCPQFWHIGQREHDLSRRQGSPKIACMPIDLAATSTTAGLWLSGQVTSLVPRNLE